MITVISTLQNQFLHQRSKTKQSTNSRQQWEQPAAIFCWGEAISNARCHCTALQKLETNELKILVLGNEYSAWSEWPWWWRSNWNSCQIKSPTCQRHAFIREVYALSLWGMFRFCVVANKSNASFHGHAQPSIVPKVMLLGSSFPARIWVRRCSASAIFSFRHAAIAAL